MINPLEIDIAAQELSEDELFSLGELLLKARDIQENSQLSRAIEDVMKKKAKKITSLSDLRKKANSIEMTPDEE